MEAHHLTPGLTGILYRKTLFYAMLTHFRTHQLIQLSPQAHFTQESTKASGNILIWVVAEEQRREQGEI